MDKFTFNGLLDKYIAGNASEAERKLLESYYDELIHHDADPLKDGEDGALQKEMLSAILSNVRTIPGKSGGRNNKRIFFLRIATAAAVLIFIIGGFIFFRAGKQPAQKNIAVAAKPSVKAVVHGTNKAILTLGNGSKIVLDSAGNGELQQQGGTSVTKTGAHLLYDSKNDLNDAVTYNTLTTPKGGQYHLTLADGTEVWLNASSSIRYPASFYSDERNVEITGEAYFEVAKNPHQPFHVKANNMTVEVLGTHFNISSYSDEATINTTLLEGSVKIKSGGGEGLLSPGQQARFNAALQSVHIEKNADTEKAMAWLNGMLMFKREDIRTIMRQVSRWYDVEINYEGEVSSKLYSGTISKYANISEVFRILELGGIKFRMEGNRITVLQ